MIMSSSESESESSESSSSSSRGGEEEVEEEANNARLVRAAVRATSEVCVFVCFLLVFEFYSFFLPRCVFVFPKGVLNSLSLSL